MMGRGRPLNDRPEYVTARLWDVDWKYGGMGKHGNGPFATEAQALACQRAIGFPGTPVLCLFQLSPDDLARIVRKLKTGIPGRAGNVCALLSPKHAPGP